MSKNNCIRLSKGDIVPFDGGSVLLGPVSSEQKIETIFGNVKLYRGYYKITSRKEGNHDKRCWNVQIKHENSRISLDMYEDPFTGELVHQLVKEEVG